MGRGATEQAQVLARLCVGSKSGKTMYQALWPNWVTELACKLADLLAEVRAGVLLDQAVSQVSGQTYWPGGVRSYI